MTQDFINYVVYPVIVLAIGGLGALITTSVVKYFNRLNLTLTELNKSIQALILDQTVKHGKQDKELSLLKEELNTEKIIRGEHRKGITELFEITDKHEIAIAILQQK